MLMKLYETSIETDLKNHEAMQVDTKFVYYFELSSEILKPTANSSSVRASWAHGMPAMPTRGNGTRTGVRELGPSRVSHLQRARLTGGPWSW
jgi:hypothetical protein